MSSLTKSFEMTERTRWLALLIVSLGVFMATLDSSIVNISLPTIARYFGASLEQTEWIVMIYLLGIVSLLLTFGRLSDLTGIGRLYTAGLAVFTGASFFCGFARSIGMLITARAVQAIGAAMILSVGPAIVGLAFPGGIGGRRGQALGVVAVVVAAGSMAGPTLGGVLVEHLSWPSIFYVNVPIGIAGVAIAPRLLGVLKLFHKDRPPFDFRGTTLSAIALGSLLFALSYGDPLGWTSLSIGGTFALAAVCSVWFLIHERRITAPLVELRLFRNHTFAIANGSSMLAFSALSGAFFLLPFYLQNVMHYTSQQAGFVLILVPVMLSLVAPLSGTLSDRFGARGLTTLGLAVIAAGLFSFTTVTSDSPAWAICGRVLVIGIGNGLFQSPNNNQLLSSVPHEYLGTASGLQGTVRTIGLVLGVALAGLIVGLTGVGLDSPELLKGFHNVLGFGAGISVAGAFFCLFSSSHAHRSLMQKRQTKSSLDADGVSKSEG